MAAFCLKTHVFCFICIYADRQRDKTPHECPEYDTKESDGKVPVTLELWGMREYHLIASAPRSTLSQSGRTW